MISFTVPGDPKPKARPRVVRGRAYTPRETLVAEASVKAAARRAGVFRHGGGVEVRVRFYRGSARRVDIDNLAKTVLDALNGLAWVDDDQVVSLVAYKAIDRSQPRTEVEVEACEPPDLWLEKG